MPSKPQENKAEEVSEPVETLDFTHPDYEFFPKGRHLYRQQGFYLICLSCELQHAIFIGGTKRMVGETEEGLPILEKVG
jgi:hypothetical protein